MKTAANFSSEQMENPFQALFFFFPSRGIRKIYNFMNISASESLSTFVASAVNIRLFINQKRLLEGQRWMGSWKSLRTVERSLQSSWNLSLSGARFNFNLHFATCGSWFFPRRQCKLTCKQPALNSKSAAGKLHWRCTLPRFRESCLLKQPWCVPLKCD